MYKLQEDYFPIICLVAGVALGIVAMMTPNEELGKLGLTLAGTTVGVAGGSYQAKIQRTEPKEIEENYDYRNADSLGYQNESQRL